MIELIVSCMNMDSLFRHKSYAGSAKPSQKQTRKDDQGSRFKQVRAEDDDDDPNNTYNGNSTQQL